MLSLYTEINNFWEIQWYFLCKPKHCRCSHLELLQVWKTKVKESELNANRTMTDATIIQCLRSVVMNIKRNVRQNMIKQLIMETNYVLKASNSSKSLDNE